MDPNFVALIETTFDLLPVSAFPMHLRVAGGLFLVLTAGMAMPVLAPPVRWLRPWLKRAALATARNLAVAELWRQFWRIVRITVGP